MSTEFSTPTLINQITSGTPSINYDSANGKFVICYLDYVDYSDDVWSKVILGTVEESGNISIGDSVLIASTWGRQAQVVILDGVAIIAYFDGDVSNNASLKVVAGYINGSEIVLGSVVTVGVFPITVHGISLAIDPESHNFILCWENSWPLEGRAVIGTVSGNTVSIGSIVAFETENISMCRVVRISQDKYIVYYEMDTLGYLYAKVCTVTGSVPSFGARIKIFESTTTSQGNSNADYIGNNKVLFSQLDNTDNVMLIIGTISGDVITLDGLEVLSFSSATSYKSAPAVLYNTFSNEFFCAVILADDSIVLTSGTIDDTVINISDYQIELPILGSSGSCSMCLDVDNEVVLIANGTSYLDQTELYVLSLESIPSSFWKNFKGQREIIS